MVIVEVPTLCFKWPLFRRGFGLPLSSCGCFVCFYCSSETWVEMLVWNSLCWGPLGGVSRRTGVGDFCEQNNSPRRLDGGAMPWIPTATRVSEIIAILWNCRKPAVCFRLVSSRTTAASNTSAPGEEEYCAGHRLRHAFDIPINVTAITVAFETLDVSPPKPSTSSIPRYRGYVQR